MSKRCKFILRTRRSCCGETEDTSVRQKRHGDLREQKETTSLFSLIHRPGLLLDVPSTLHLTESYAR